MVEGSGKSSRLGHPSTILRLCNRAGVLFEDANTDRIKGGRGITKQRMEGVTDTQEERRPQEMRRRPQREEGQASDAMDLSQMQQAIEEMSQQYMREQEQQQKQYLRQQEKYLRAQEQQESWQLKMIEQQENWHLRMMDQQREFQARILEQQGEQSSHSQESFNKLFQQHAKQKKYLQDLRQWKSLYHAAREVRHLDRIEYDIETQEKLNYVVCGMPVVNQEIKPFVQCQKLVNKQRARAHRNIERMEQRLKKAGLWDRVDFSWPPK
ncbi:probable basic-leucine zipper transcription factor Q [Arachis ipaensis]|uniref:probable basic-leucine zipper transcription factor Q n=1 Tax=Arachis ipaensis TaxID=130454 RepID=UPI0007AF1335|nr:probable basic-leucine zipper transcription factor Q [Arachis ipaensis]XP_025635912.1 probable basic-leucine zipper transcription factor Q [Arachis hypogaea]